MGQFIGEKVKFLQDTACMDQDTRELLAILEFVEQIMPEMKGDIQEIKPLLEKLGYAQWQRDTVTDMALKKGSPTETEDWKVDDDSNMENTTEASESP